MSIVVSASAEMRTLTDQFGRTINAEVIDVVDDKVKIRREDGLLFDMPLDKLSDEDQIALKKWAKEKAKKEKANAPVLAPGAVTVRTSRVKMKVDVTYQYDDWKDSNEEWGYNIELNNTTLHPTGELRVDYNLFGRSYAGSSLQTQAGRETVPSIPGREKHSFRTKGLRLNKWQGYGGSSSGEIHGVWVRLYSGKTLIHEFSSPASLMTGEKWVKP